MSSYHGIDDRQMVLERGTVVVSTVEIGNDGQSAYSPAGLLYALPQQQIKNITDVNKQRKQTTQFYTRRRIDDDIDSVGDVVHNYSLLKQKLVTMGLANRQDR